MVMLVWVGRGRGEIQRHGRATSRRGKEAISKGKGLQAPARAVKVSPRSTAAPGRVPGLTTGPATSGKSNQKATATTQRVGQKQVATNPPNPGKGTLKPESAETKALVPQKTSTNKAKVTKNNALNKKSRFKNKSEDAYFQMR